MSVESGNAEVRGAGLPMATLFSIKSVVNARSVMNESRLQEVLNPGGSWYCGILSFLLGTPR